MCVYVMYISLCVFVDVCICACERVKRGMEVENGVTDHSQL